VLASIALVYAAMIPAVSAFAAILCVSGLWGFANHLGLNILVLRLTRIGAECRGAVLALNSAVTYAGALFGAWLFGIIYEGVGFAAVAGAAALCTGVAATIAPAEARRAESAFPRSLGGIGR
jgi:predicted MFS family arabinose efflux permease